MHPAGAAMNVVEWTRKGDQSATSDYVNCCKSDRCRLFFYARAIEMLDRLSGQHALGGLYRFMIYNHCKLYRKFKQKISMKEDWEKETKKIQSIFSWILIWLTNDLPDSLTSCFLAPVWGWDTNHISVPTTLHKRNEQNVKRNYQFSNSRNLELVLLLRYTQGFLG